MTRNIRTFDGIRPALAESCFVDETALVIGDVVLAEDVSVWPMAVIRADVNSVRIGARSNVQDFTMIHQSHKSQKDPAGAPVVIGEDVTIGHHVTLHGCLIGDRVLVGMGATSPQPSHAANSIPHKPRCIIGLPYAWPPTGRSGRWSRSERYVLRRSGGGLV